MERKRGFGSMRQIILNPILQANTINDETPVAERLRAYGNNLGNMVFVNAMKRQIPYEREEWISEDMEVEKDSVYVIPCSNFLSSSNKWLEPLADIIDKKDIRIVLAGLGTQAELDGSPRGTVGKLSKKQKLFFQIIAERCRSIGVRGEYTAECLESIGVRNSRVIGCPSVFLDLNADSAYEVGRPTLEKPLVTVTPSRGGVYRKTGQTGKRIGCGLDPADEG